MSSNLSEKLAGVLTALEQDGVGYVLYHEPQPNRIVIFVESRADVAAVQAALQSVGAESGTQDSGPEFVIRSAEDSAKPGLVLTAEAGSSKTPIAIATLLWLAAIDEGASAARDSLDHAS
jgi:hypothetical protein